MIKILKLVKGKEIVGDVTHTTLTEVIIEKPLQINYRYFMGSTPTASFVRYCMFGEETYANIVHNHIVTHHTARDSFCKVYHDNAEHYYGQHQQMIDQELENSTHEQSSAPEEQLKKLLEMMPIEGAQVN